MSLADLLPARYLVEGHDSHVLPGLEIGRRIVEGKMAIFADPGEGNVDGR